MKTTLLSLDSPLSSGPDGIPSIILKYVILAMALPLPHLSLSLSLYIYIYIYIYIYLRDQKPPFDWKIALTPIHAKGPTSSPGNHRPISITSTCCRVMERIINRSLVYHPLNHKSINWNQHGSLSGGQCILGMVWMCHCTGSSANQRNFFFACQG